MGWLRTIRIDRSYDLWWSWFSVVEDDDFTYLEIHDYD